MAAYFAELDATFPTGFDPGDALTAEATLFERPTGRFVVVRTADATIGCAALQTLEPGVGEIKRMWIAPEWRGLGLAARLLGELESRSRAIGHRMLRLDTNATLTKAIALYERSGFVAIDRYNDNPYAQRWFEKRLG
jgi:GNAT superfamily N-acetyltransferase